MSHEVLITRRQSIFDFFANPGRGGPQKAGASWCWLPGMLRPASAWICKKIKNALSSGYQDLMGHLILTTSPWSILTWITLLPSDQKTALGALVIVGAVYVIGVIVFQIWTIIVANRARKEIGLEKHDLKIKKDLIYYWLCFTTTFENNKIELRDGVAVHDDLLIQ